MTRNKVQYSLLSFACKQMTFTLLFGGIAKLWRLDNAWWFCHSFCIVLVVHPEGFYHMEKRVECVLFAIDKLYSERKSNLAHLRINNSIECSAKSRKTLQLLLPCVSRENGDTCMSMINANVFRCICHCALGTQRSRYHSIHSVRPTDERAQNIELYVEYKLIGFSGGDWKWSLLSISLVYAAQHDCCKHIEAMTFVDCLCVGVVYVTSLHSIGNEMMWIFLHIRAEKGKSEQNVCLTAAVPVAFESIRYSHSLDLKLAREKELLHIPTYVYVY